MATRTLHLCFLALFSTTQTGYGFNIDVRFPVIKEGKTKDSLFGFSVAQHKQTQKSKQYMLLIGAPKEQAFPQLKPKVNETGAIYTCPVSTDPTDCTRMDLVSSTDSSEIVEGMWLGVSVSSQRRIEEGRVLACGHRYIKSYGSDGQRSMVGKCYVRGNDLTYDPSDEWQTHTYEACSPFDLDLEGLCNMGISAGMTDTDVYMGAVGSFTWQGNVHVTWRDTNPFNSWDYSDKDFGKLEKNSYDYMGYSVVEETKLLSRDEDTLVAGAPREAESGAVTLAKKDDGKLLIPVTTIIGDQLGSYFGSSIAVTDLNNDDWNDLIIGAPFYFERKEERGGAVYVYMNENGSFQKKASVVLYGTTNSAFGIAVAAIGDVNQDGFQDFAVGAPFEGSGKVYIWMGSMKGISAGPSQVIEGKDVGTEGFKTFGYSLSGGLDMDENMYPDILVGSLDDRIALLRARPVIHLSTDFSVEPKIVDSSQCGDPCIKVKICFSFILSNGNKAFNREITLKYTVEADIDRRSPRVRFVDSRLGTHSDLMSLSSKKCVDLGLSVDEIVVDKLRPVVFSLNVSLQEQNIKVKRTLQNLDAFPILSDKQNLRKRTEINFQKECGSDNRCTSNLQLTAQCANERYQPFPRNGGQQVMKYNSNVKKVVLMVVVTNLPELGREAEDAHQASINVTLPPTLLYSGRRSQVRSPADGSLLTDSVECRADLTFVNCDLGNPLKSYDQVDLQLIFETAGITLFTEEIELQLQLGTLSHQTDLDPVAVPLRVENTILSSFSIDPSVVQTYFSGAVMGESAMNSTSDVGSLIEHTFKVGVDGEPLGSLGTLVLEFEWPFEVINGKWLLYLTEIVTKGKSETRCVPPGDVVNLLNLPLSGEHSRRQRRDAHIEAYSDPPVEAAVSILTPRKETYLLECSKGTARCITFSCPLINMSNYAEVIVRSRVWNSTMLEDYSNALRVKVKGEVTLKLVTDKPNIKMDSQSRDFLVNIDPVLAEEAPYEIPFWIFIIAGAAGVLLLSIIIFVLWKCGFFKRASRREMYEAKSQKAEMKIQPSETERLTDDY
ncbi:integrin alpha-3b isoform X1 [Alosa sapidissima]|uniref:integrin alpha-3b isoform X1 n=1 Tax=Alosa sapidissima TaxID=34773 RepID=UPI001C080DA5|nr:integrin alpha-3b isoform X1 [Alosa sapidissima]XP_041937819.1 integrin alpha-3b isoform X1 [Alosa sapidissima]